MLLTTIRTMTPGVGTSVASFQGLPPPSSFWWLAVCKKKKGKGLVHFIMWMTSVSTWVPDWKNKLEALSCSFCPECWGFKCSRSKNLTTPGSKRRISVQNTIGNSFPLSCHSREKMDQAFPLRFAYCKPSKTEQWEGLGTRLLQVHTPVATTHHFLLD